MTRPAPSWLRRPVGLLLAGTALVALGSVAGAQPTGSPRVLVATVDGAITPVIAEYLSDGVGRAERSGHDAFVVRLDTPGGLDTSMRRIIQRFLAARVPVIVHVAPEGARAASAGAIITFSAHVAAMAPGTAIGAATPVDLGGGGDVERKVVNDAAALAESVARLRGRNVSFAGETVRKGRSVAAQEAVELQAVDFLARSLSEVLERADGRELEVAPGERRVTLRTAGAAVEEHDLGLLGQIRQRLADPNLAFLFMSLGTLALIYELANPGIGGGAIVGVILLLLGLTSLSVLEVNVVGLLFLGLAALLFVAELFAPGLGVAAAGGAVALVLAGIFLFRGTPGVAVSAAVFLPAALVVGGGVVVAGRLALRARRAPSTTTGADLLRGRLVVVGRAEGTRGQGFVEGAWWSLRSTGASLEEGTVVRVMDVEGLDLVVEPAQERTTQEAEKP